MRRFFADIWALQFGRADKWWAWLITLVLICGMLWWRAPTIFMEAQFLSSIVIFAVLSAVGVFWRRMGRKDD